MLSPVSAEIGVHARIVAELQTLPSQIDMALFKGQILEFHTQVRIWHCYPWCSVCVVLQCGMPLLLLCYVECGGAVCHCSHSSGVGQVRGCEGIEAEVHCGYHSSSSVHHTVTTTALGNHCHTSKARNSISVMYWLCRNSVTM